jgi:hypothetical protein
VCRRAQADKEVSRLQARLRRGSAGFDALDEEPGAVGQANRDARAPGDVRRRDRESQRADRLIVLEAHSSLRNSPAS